MLENALFVHTFVYMVELTVTGWCIITICIAISDSFELNIRFLTFYCDPYFLFQILMFLNIMYNVLLEDIFHCTCIGSTGEDQAVGREVCNCQNRETS